MLVQDLLEPLIQFLTLAEQIVQANFAEHRPERRLRKLGRCIQVVFYLDDGPKRVHHPKINNGIHFHADVVFRDDVLSGNVHCDCAETHADDPVNRPKHPDQTWTFRFSQQAADTENHAALILAKDIQRIEEPDQNDDYRDQHQWKLIHSVPFCSGGL